MDELELLRMVADRAAVMLTKSVSAFDVGAELAVRDLDRALKELRHWQRHGGGATVSGKLQPCAACGRQVFLARRVNGTWMSLEVETVPAVGITPGWQWVVDFSGPEPMVTFDPRAVIVWINHGETCGAGGGPRVAAPPYMRRYRQNLELLPAHRGGIIDSMKAMHARYSDPATYRADPEPIESDGQIGR